jgi:hypothetical protein
MIALGLGTLVAIAAIVAIVAQLGSTHPRTATVTHRPAVSRALGVSGTPSPGPARASHSTPTNAPLSHGTSAVGHQPGAVAPVTADAAVSATGGAHTTIGAQATERKSYGAVP